MDLAAGLAFAAGRSKGTLVTIGNDDRPQVSNILYVLDGDVASISLTDDRVKTRNLRTDPRACLHVTDESFWQYVVLDARSSSPRSPPTRATARRTGWSPTTAG